LKTRDLDTLNYLARQPFFAVTPGDLTSFTLATTFTQPSWPQGAKALLQSPAATVAYQGLYNEGQVDLLKAIIDLVLQHSDVKQRKLTTTVLVEEVLCKRPYTRALTLLLLNDSDSNPLRSSGWFDLAKLARECLKGLTSEDFR